jgi:hypothetical protein
VASVLNSPRPPLKPVLKKVIPPPARRAPSPPLVFFQDTPVPEVYKANIAVGSVNDKVEGRFSGRAFDANFTPAPVVHEANSAVGSIMDRVDGRFKTPPFDANFTPVPNVPEANSAVGSIIDRSET